MLYLYQPEVLARLLQAVAASHQPREERAASEHSSPASAGYRPCGRRRRPLLIFRAVSPHATPKLIAAVYQKVVPAPIFALVIEISQLSGPTGGPGAGAGAGAGNPLAALLGASGAGATATPARPQASAADIDDSPVPGAGAGVSAYEVADDAEDGDEAAEQEQDQDSPAAGSTTSGTSWENVEEA